MTLPFMQVLMAASTGASLDSEILADTPFAYWRFDELTGATTLVGVVNSRDLLPTNSPTLQQPPLVSPGFSIDFNGTTQYATTTNNQYGTAIAAAFNGDRAFSLEAVIRLDVIAGSTRAVIHVGNFSLGGSQGFDLQVNPDGSLALQAFISGAFVSVTSPAGLIVTGTDYLVTCTRAVGGAAFLYINGVQVQTGTLPGSVAAAAGAGTGGMRLTTGTLFGAAGGGNPAGFLDGRIDYPCIFASALSPTRVLAHAQAAGFAPVGDPFWANVSALLHLDGTDTSTFFPDITGKTWTAGGNAQVDTAFFQFPTGSALFNGSGDFISTPAHADFGFGTGDFTIEGFVRRTDATAVDRPVIELRAATGQPALFYLLPTTRVLGYFSTALNLSGGAAPAINTQVHVAWSRQAGTLRAFSGGVLQWSLACGDDFGATRPCRIGGNFNASSSFNGNIDEIRITRGVARYAANFVPPSAPFPNGPSNSSIYATLNTADTSANLTLSGGNLTFVRNVGGGSWASVRANQGKQSGKWYFEVRNNANGATNGDIMIGFMRNTDVLTTYPGNVAQSTASIGWQMNMSPDSVKFKGGTGSLGAQTGYGFANTAQYSHIAVDLDAGNVWVRNSSGSGWAGGGDPTTGTLPTFTIPAGSYVYPAFGQFSNPASATVNFGATAFNGTVPSGFNSGWYT